MIKQLLSIVLMLVSTNLLAQDLYLPDLSIVAFVARNSQDRNEFKNKADWIEIQYLGNEAYELKKLKLYVSDRSSELPLKFELPPRTLNPGDVWRIWCDSENIYSNQVHTNFRLSKRGEDLGLFYLADDESIHELDRWTYTRIPKDACGKRKLLSGEQVLIPQPKD